jgi:hypothetical protein
MPQVGMWYIHQTADNMNIQEHCQEPQILPNVNFLEFTAVKQLKYIPRLQQLNAFRVK